MQASLLKREYLTCLGSLSTTAVTLRRVVIDLVDVCGVTRQEPVLWAEEAGYNRRSVRSLLSKLLCARGRRQRKPGAGRKPNKDARAIAESICAQYGHDRAPRLLRAAARIAQSLQVPLVPDGDLNISASPPAYRHNSLIVANNNSSNNPGLTV